MSGVWSLERCDSPAAPGLVAKVVKYIQQTPHWQGEGRVLLEYVEMFPASILVHVNIRQRTGAIFSVCSILQGTTRYALKGIVH